ncbi:MAG TPA: M14 metallopeptidase family protein [Vicinamibacterales bacterium]|jgi:hypothetical protein
MTIRLPRSIGLALVVLVVVLAPLSALAQVPPPESFFGFRMGTDGRLADWPEIERYFQTVAAAASDRVKIVDAGKSTEGRRLIAAIISAPENVKRLDAIRAANQRLADPRALTEQDAAALLAGHKVVVAIGASIHASEIGATQMANELLYELATSSDPRTLAILRDVVVVLFPSLNPDGHVMVVDWHKKMKGTAYEGGSMPWLYHKYAGHDINRDGFMMNLAENRALARFFYSEWHPQVFLAMHQMGQTGARMFVPPNYDPVHPNYDPLIWRESAVLGQAMALELERHNRAGVVSNALYDYYWPGYEDSVPLGHNTVCLLTEVASARLAAPATVTPAELARSSAPGLPEYKPQVTFPNPWPGGTWRLRDIVDYELDAVHGLLQAASLYRPQLVEDFYVMGKRAVEQGLAGGPFAFVIPPEQADPSAAARLVNLLIDGAVDVRQAQEPFRAGDTTYPAGSALILMAQPYRAYAKTLLEKQDYPARRLARGATPERPYDVAGWTLPWQFGVKVDRIEAKFEQPMTTRLARGGIAPAQVWGERRPGYFLVDAPGISGILALNRLVDLSLKPEWLTSAIETNGYWYPAGALVLRDGPGVRDAVTALARELGLRADGMRGVPPANAVAAISGARVGLYKPWFENTDEGWTRYLLEQYKIPFRSMADDEIRQGNLRAGFDVIILPDASAQRLLNGQSATAVPPEYAGGLTEKGIAALKAFVESGGTLVCLGGSGQLAIDALGLPVKDVVRGVPPEQFFCPGSLLALQVDTTRPLAYGMKRETAAFMARGSAFESDPARSGAGRVRVVARYADKNVLLSGWLEGEQAIAGRPAVVEVALGTGRVVLYGIRPQHRAQSLATFRLLLNALFLSSSR